MDTKIELVEVSGLSLHPAAGMIPRMREDEQKALWGSIKADGVQEPLVVQGPNVILDGRHRWEGAKAAGVERVPVRYVELSEAGQVLFILRSAIVRRHLSDDQRAVLAARLRKPLSEAAKKSRSERANEKKHGEVSLSPPVGDKEKTDTRQQVAEALNVSRKKVERALALEEADPELAERVLAGEVRLSRAVRETNRRERRSEAVALPADKFSVIYADPPWQYDFSPTESRQIENQYPTMSLEGICALKVGEVAAEDAVLFLWATNPKLREALQVIEKWGFEYVTNMVWVKDKIGMGFWVRGQHELLLIARHGNPVIPEEARRPASVVTAKRGAHSSKPKEFYDLMERMCPGQKYLELFARTERAGWTAWGNEVGAK